jgi:hypothetical protein
MKNMDQFLRKKFEEDTPETRFEFNEAYWEEARLMLEAAERKRKRRGFIWFWSCLLLLAVAGIAWFGYQSCQNQIASTENTAVGISSTTGNDATTIVQNPPQPVDKTNNYSSVSQQTHPTATPNASSAFTPTHTNKSGAKNHSTAQTTDQQTNSSFDQPTTLPSGFNPSENIQAGQQTPEQNNKALELNPLILEARSLDSTMQTPPNPIQKLDLKVLDLPFLPAIRQESTLEKEPIATTLPDQPTRVFKARKWHIGLEMAGAGYRARGNDNNGVGGTLGLLAQWQLRPKISLQAGIRYRLAAAFQEDIQQIAPDVTQLRYSFGYNRSEFRVQTNHLHQLEIPIGIQYQQNKWRFETGLGIGFVLTGSGELIESGSGSLTENFVRTANQWIKTDPVPFRQRYSAFHAGAAYQVRSALQIFGRAQVRISPSSPLDPEVKTFENVQWFDLGFRVGF